MGRRAVLSESWINPTPDVYQSCRPMKIKDTYGFLSRKLQFLCSFSKANLHLNHLCQLENNKQNHQQLVQRPR